MIMGTGSRLTNDLCHRATHHHHKHQDHHQHRHPHDTVVSFRSHTHRERLIASYWLRTDCAVHPGDCNRCWIVQAIWRGLVLAKGQAQHFLASADNF